MRWAGGDSRGRYEGWRWGAQRMRSSESLGEGGGRKRKEGEGVPCAGRARRSSQSEGGSDEQQQQATQADGRKLSAGSAVMIAVQTWPWRAPTALTARQAAEVISIKLRLATTNYQPARSPSFAPAHPLTLGRVSDLRQPRVGDGRLAHGKKHSEGRVVACARVGMMSILVLPTCTLHCMDTDRHSLQRVHLLTRLFWEWPLC